MEETATDLVLCQTEIKKIAVSILAHCSSSLQIFASRLPFLTNRLVEKNEAALDVSLLKMRNGAKHLFSVHESNLNEKEAFFKLSSPQYILAKGYSITSKNGKSVKSTQELHDGDTVETTLADGKF
jgi:exodeoxyribonuclease VII large subunit